MYTIFFSSAATSAGHVASRTTSAAAVATISRAPLSTMFFRRVLYINLDRGNLDLTMIQADLKTLETMARDERKLFFHSLLEVVCYAPVLHPSTALLLAVQDAIGEDVNMPFGLIVNYCVRERLIMNLLREHVNSVLALPAPSSSSQSSSSKVER